MLLIFNDEPDRFCLNVFEPRDLFEQRIIG